MDFVNDENQHRLGDDAISSWSVANIEKRR